MNIRDGYNSSKKVVTFDMQDRLDNQLDKITFMISKLTTQGSNHNRPLKPKIYQSKRRGQMRKYYDQGKYQNRCSGDRRMSYSGRAWYGQNYRRRLQYDHNFRSDFRRGNFRGPQY